MALAWAETCSSVHVQVIIYNKACVVLDRKPVPCLTADRTGWLTSKFPFINVYLSISAYVSKLLFDFDRKNHSPYFFIVQAASENKCLLLTVSMFIYFR